MRLPRRSRTGCPPDFLEPSFPELQSPLDFELSPYTGWTRCHWDELATLLLSGIADYFTPGCALIEIPGRLSAKGRRVDGLEGFARTLGLAASWCGRSAGTTVTAGSGCPVDLLDCFRRGLRHGTDPQHPEYWGPIGNFDQRVLEAADIAWSIYIARHQLWDPLPQGIRDKVAEWLAGIAGKNVKANNWVLAKVMVNIVLKALGCRHSEQEIRQGLDFIDCLHVGGGWYQDGMTESYDYYAAWMFHDYLLKLLFLPGALDPGRADVIKDRSERFLRCYQHFFGANGSHVAFGRSLIYRSAAVSPLVMSMLVGNCRVDPGTCRRLASGNLKFFLDRGMFSRRGTLTLGFTRPLLPLLEDYSCGSSPYMIGRTFSALLLPAGHPYWAAQENPLPVERGDFSLAVRPAGLLVDGEHRTGQVQIINHGSGNIAKGREKKYGNISYSSHFGFTVPVSPGGCNFDSALLISRDGRSFAGRPKPLFLQLEPGFGRSYSLPLKTDKTVVYLNTILCDHFQIRVHLVVSNEPFAVKEGGYALAFGSDRPEVLSGPDWEFAACDAGATFIRRLVGYDHNVPAAGGGDDDGGQSILGARSLTPGVGLTLGPHGSILLATLVRGDVAGATCQGMVQFVRACQWGPNWLRLELTCGDALFTQIGAVADRVIEVNGRRLGGRTAFARVSADGEIRSHILATDPSSSSLPHPGETCDGV